MIELDGKKYYTKEEKENRVIFIDKSPEELNIEEINRFLKGKALVLVNNYSIIQTKDDKGNITKTYIGLKGLGDKYE